MSELQPDDPRTLTQRAARGAAWALAGRGVSQAIGLVFSLVLWRLLVPADFGLLVPIMAVIYVLGDLRDLRFSHALIQRKDLSGIHLDSIFYLHAGVGLALTLLVLAAALLLGSFSRRQELVPIVAALGLMPFIESLADVPRALLTRRMAFNRIALADVASLVVSGASAVVLAILGYGPWALVSLSLVGAVLTTLILIVSAGWLPRLRASWAALCELGRFSFYLYGARNLATFGRNVDKILVGAFCGHAAAGLYGQGFKLMRFPLERIADVVSRVMYAALSEIRDDLERLRNAYLRAVRLLSLITFPVTLGLCVTAAEFVLAVGKAKWAGAIPIIRILCVASFVESVAMTARWIFFARGRTDREFAWTFVPVIVTVVAVALGLRHGVKGVAVAYLIRTLLLVVPTFLVAFRLIELRLWPVLRALVPTAVSAVIMAGAVLGLRGLLITHFDLTVWPLLFAEVACGVVVYVGCLWMGRAEVFREVMDLGKDFLQKRKRAAQS